MACAKRVAEPRALWHNDNWTEEKVNTMFEQVKHYFFFPPRKRKSHTPKYHELKFRTVFNTIYKNKGRLYNEK